MTKCAIYLQESVVSSHKRETERPFFEHPTETFLAFAQPCVGLFALGNVLSSAYNANRLAFVISNNLGNSANKAHLAIRANDSVLPGSGAGTDATDSGQFLFSVVRMNAA